MFPSDVWCKMYCIQDNVIPCEFNDCCDYRKKYLRAFGRKQRHAIRRWKKKNNGTEWPDDIEYLPYTDLISLSKVYLMTGFKCWYCGKKMGVGEGHSDDLCTIDHRIAIINGGSNSIDNIVLCCWDCNKRKGRK